MTNYLSTKWRAWPYKMTTLIVLLTLIFVFIGLTAVKSRKGQAPATAEKPLPQVQVNSLEALTKDASLDITASVELSTSAPLVARMGGRVTAVRAPLGSQVFAGQVVVEIDGGAEANPARVQAATSQEQLVLFGEIESQTKAALNNGVAIAQHGLNAARAGSGISVDIQEKARQAASTGIEQAKVAQEQAVHGADDFTIRSANIGVNAAEFAQDQATLAIRLAQQQGSDTVKQAQRNLEAAHITQRQTLANLASQKAGLAGQFKAAAEQVKLMQVTAGAAGEVARLTVKVGDFVRPGDIVGEIVQSGRARASLLVPQGARNLLVVGQPIPVTVDGQKQMGTIAALAKNPSAATALWQVDIALAGAVSPNSAITVSLPLKSAVVNHVFVPLDAVNVREAGIILFTVDKENVVHEHAFTAIHYYEHVVEGTVQLPADATVVVSGNRTLKDGDTVTVAGK